MGKKSACKIINVESCDVSLKPLLVEFEHGLLKKELVDKVNCEFMKNANDPEEYMLTINSQNNDYKYRTNKINEDTNLCQRFFVIRNKRTNKIRLASIDQISVSRFFKKSSNSELKPDDATPTVNRIEFMEAFGSKSALKRIHQYSMNQSHTDDYQSRLEESVKVVDVSDKDLTINFTQDELSVVPPPNPNATSVNNIFTLESLFGSSDVLESLDELAKSIVSHPPTEPDDDCSEFLVTVIQRMIMRANSSQLSPDNVKCVIYADALLKFTQMTVKQLLTKTNSYAVCPLSKHIRNLIMNEFTVKSETGTRTRPLRMKDKAACYILVLLMIAFHFKLEQDFVSTQLEKVANSKKLLLLGKAVGFTSVFGQKLWTLQYPYVQVTHSPRKKRSRR